MPRPLRPSSSSIGALQPSVPVKVTESSPIAHARPGIYDGAGKRPNPFVTAAPCRRHHGRRERLRRVPHRQDTPRAANEPEPPAEVMLNLPNLEGMPVQVRLKREIGEEWHRMNGGEAETTP